MTVIPRDPAGGSGLVQTVKNILRCLREQRILPDPTIRVVHESSGTRITVVGVKKSGGGDGADDMVWL